MVINDVDSLVETAQFGERAWEKHAEGIYLIGSTYRTDQLNGEEKN